MSADVLTYKSPLYVHDIFHGAWLRVSDEPETHSFTSWFRADETVNKVLTSQLVVPWIPDESLHRYLSLKWRGLIRNEE